MPPAGSRARNKKKTTSVPPKRGQVFKRVLGSLFSWLPRCRCRLPRGRRGNRVPANGGHVEPEPDVANNAPPPATTHTNRSKSPCPLVKKQVHGDDEDDDDGGCSQLST